MPRSDPSRARERSPTAEGPVRDRSADWVQDHLDAVYRYARRRLPAPDAEDVAQEAFEALFRAEAEGRAPDDPGAYLIGCARRRLADRWRESHRRPPPVALPAQWALFDETALPPDVLEATELRELVHVALGLLPPASARILLARYRAGRSLAEIAANLDVTPKAAEARLRRARHGFKEHFLRIGHDWTREAPDDVPRDGPPPLEGTP